MPDNDLEHYMSGRRVAQELASNAGGGRDIATLSRLERELAERARTDPQARARCEALQFYRNETFAAVREFLLFGLVMVSDEARFDRLEQAFRDALVGFRESKEAFANASVNVAIIAGSTLATGGLSLGPILAAAAAGATLRLGANMLIQGADFEYTSRNVLGHLASGSVEGAFSVAAPGLLARIPGISRAVGGSAARTVATRLGLEAESAAGRAVAAEVERAVAGALINRAAGVTESEIAAIATRLARQGYGNITRQMLTEAIGQAIRQESASAVRAAAMEFLHAAGNTATGMGSGALGSIVDQGIGRGHLDMHEVWTNAWQGGLSGLSMTAVGRGLHYGPGRRLEHATEHLQQQAARHAELGLTGLAREAHFGAGCS